MLFSADGNFPDFFFFSKILYRNAKCLGTMAFFPPTKLGFFQLVKEPAKKKKKKNRTLEEKKKNLLFSVGSIVHIFNYFLLSADHKFCSVKRNKIDFDLLQV